MPRTKEAALRAVQLDPNLASAHVKLGYVHLFYDWDWPAAEKALGSACGRKSQGSALDLLLLRSNAGDYRAVPENH